MSDPEGSLDGHMHYMRLAAERAKEIDRLSAMVAKALNNGYQQRQEIEQLKSRQSGVVLPEHRDQDLKSPVYGFAKGWNACLDEVARLNSSAVSAGDNWPKQECPATGQVTDVDPADMGIEQPSIVAFMQRPQYYDPYVSISRDTSCDCVEPLMEVKQHERIIAAVTRPADPDMVQVPRELLVELLEYRTEEAAQHKEHMSAYRPKRQAYLDSQVEELRAILSSKGGDQNG